MGKLIPACIALLMSASAWSLDVGSRLPALSEVAWFGDPVDVGGAFAIVDLWSPDNPACRATMPRLTDLQRRHPEVRIVGLTAVDPGIAKEFVAGMGSRVGYAIGTVPSLAPFSPPVGGPIALLIDRSGTVLWWGDAVDIPMPLAQALAGTFVPAPPVPMSPSPQQQPEALPPQQPTEAPAAPLPPQPQPQSHVERSSHVSVVVVGTPWSWCPSAWCAPNPLCWIPRPPCLPILPPPPCFFFSHTAITTESVC